MRHILGVCLLALCACATTYQAPRTTAQLDVTARALPKAASRSVLVVSPASFQTVAPDVTFAAPTPAESEANDFALPAQAVERQLFEAKWDPLPQVTFAKLVTSHGLAVALRELSGRGQASLLEAAALVGAASTADMVLVLKDWRLSWSPEPAARSKELSLCQLAAQLDMALYDKAGRPLWQGRVDARASDLMDLSMTVGWSEKTVSVPAYSCLAAKDCSRCDAVEPPAISVKARVTMTTHAAKVLVQKLTEGP